MISRVLALAFRGSLSAARTISPHRLAYLHQGRAAGRAGRRGEGERRRARCLLCGEEVHLIAGMLRVACCW